MANWRRRFDEPIHLWDGRVIRTLADARAWLLETDSDQNQFQYAAGKIMAAADGGSPSRRRGRVPQHEAGRQQVEGLRKYTKVAQVLTVDLDAGTVRDATAEIMAEVRERGTVNS